MKEKNNIIKFPNKNKEVTQNKSLSDADINNLFLGLVKLVKKNITEQINIDKNTTETNYRKALVLIADKDSEINQLKSKNNSLTQKLNLLNEKIQQLRMDKMSGE